MVDFGIAKAPSPSLDTAEYPSPEQAQLSALDIDAREVAAGEVELPSERVRWHRVAAIECDRASAEAEIARRVTEFTAGLFKFADPALAGSSEVSARALFEARLRGIVEDRRRISGPAHPSVGVAPSSVGNTLSDFRERLEGTEGVHAEAISVLRAAYGGPQPEIATALNSLGVVCNRMQRWQSARDV
jgi:hypothetical protein